MRSVCFSIQIIYIKFLAVPSESKGRVRPLGPTDQCSPNLPLMTIAFM